MFYTFKNIIICFWGALIIISCGPGEIDKGNGFESLSVKEEGIRFYDLKESINNETSNIIYTAKVVSDKPIKTVSLWGETGNSFERFDLKEVDGLGQEMILNHDFEDFSIDIATKWSIWKSISTKAKFKSDAGYVGLSQHISVSSLGSWGLFLFQTPGFERDKKYRLSFWYKTSDASPLYIDIGGSYASESIYMREIRGTSGIWKKIIYDFYSQEGRIKQARIGTKHEHDFWIDEMSIKEIINETEKFEVEVSFEIPSSQYIDSWYLVASDKINTTKSQVLETNN